MNASLVAPHARDAYVEAGVRSLSGFATEAVAPVQGRWA
jgi:hypothetical protein